MIAVKCFLEVAQQLEYLRMKRDVLMRYSITIHFQKCAEWARQACWSVAAYFVRPQNRDKSNQIKVRLWDNQRVNRDHAATRTGRSSDIQAINVTVHLLLC